ncbi:ABC transporter ATP-binding protein [Campylobacter suis]|uniref:Lipoprotein-releasing system ATP-binding protein LolD n=1 Tax=Campylobacter suis TaxID=2790657 RepID=A0ABN7KA22_9BACT|nr:ABC transporter ATP-binding protein [Campylobacter suis]CAD7289242.1 Lipoprotein-releasing system ATP-binding protein LolD [Campylobacter suis]
MIQINNLFKIYNQGKVNEFCALKDINLSINDGEIVILKGVSGSGKSTLLSLMGGLSKPSSGEILINGQNISKLPDFMSSSIRHKELGFIFQSFNLIDGLSVEQNVMAPLSLLGLKKAEILTKIDNALNLANIAHKKEQLVSSLSGGEKQRCAVARALVMDPDIILADEPTANLDKENSLMFIQMMQKFKSLNKTLIVATHDLLFDELEFVDKRINMRDGEIL